MSGVLPVVRLTSLLGVAARLFQASRPQAQSQNRNLSCSCKFRSAIFRKATIRVRRCDYRGNHPHPPSVLHCLSNSARWCQPNLMQPL